MEFLKNVKHRRRTFMNEMVYIGLNIGLSASLVFLVKVTGTIWPALVLVLLSMWRVFAVRPQFWFANIQANLVSAIVSISYVIFLYTVNIANINESYILILQIILAVLFACWLLFLKPRSKRCYIAAQAGVALFSGVSAIFMMAYDWVASPVVILVWLVGYAVARHVIGNYDTEDHITLLSMSWGLVAAEIGWLAYHWTVAYQLSNSASLLLPQVSIIITSLGFVAYKAYDSYSHNQKIRMNDILLPLIFTAGIILVLVLAFNGATNVAL